MHFVDDTELTVFIWRHVSATLEMKKFVPESNQSLCSRLEELVCESNDWRISENDFTRAFQSLPVNDEMIQNIQTCAYTVGKEREREIVDDIFGVNVTVDHASHLPENLVEAIRLLTAVVSIAVYPKDILSTSYLLSALCPTVLPALKRISVSRKLNLTQSLISYVQKAVIDGDAGDNPVLKENIHFLKNLLKAIEDIHDKFDEIKEPKRGIRAGFEAANKFLVICENAGNNLSPALKQVYSVIDEVVSNYNEITKTAPNSQQSKPSFFNKIERVCQSVVDRLTIMTPIENVSSFSPSLRTPAVKVQTPMRENTTTVTTSVSKQTPSTKTPTHRFNTFLNNNTPTPRRNTIQTLHELLEAEKENIDPLANAYDVENDSSEKKDSTPVRAPKEKGLKVRRSFGNAQQAKRAPTQRSIMTFFKQ